MPFHDHTLSCTRNIADHSDLSVNTLCDGDRCEKKRPEQKPWKGYASPTCGNPLARLLSCFGIASLSTATPSVKLI